MKIAIIGNGGCALNKKNGTFIDTCDKVVRMKNFVTSGFEQYVGEKTNIFSSKWFSWFDRTTNEPLTFDFIKKIETFIFMFFDPNEEFDLQYYPKYIQLYDKLQLKNEFPMRNGSKTLHNEKIKEYGIDFNKIEYMTPDEINDLTYNLLKIKNDYYRKDVNFESIIEPTVGIRTIYKILKLYENEEIYLSGFDGFETSWYWDSSHKANNAHFYLKERIVLNYFLKKPNVINLDV